VVRTTPRPLWHGQCGQGDSEDGALPHKPGSCSIDALDLRTVWQQYLRRKPQLGEQVDIYKLYPLGQVEITLIHSVGLVPDR
jgi:hypothetical protein